MKSTLNTTLLAVVLASAAFADNGLDSRIVNEDGSAYSGDITISYNMDDTVGVENQRGGVERTENGDTTLTGNISIIGGADYATLVDEERRTHGVYLSEDMSSGTVTLKTGSAADAININVYGAAGTGLRNQSSGAKLVVDASGSDHAIEIHARNASEEAAGGAAIYSSGVTEVKGSEVNLSTAAKSASGLYVVSGGQVDVKSGKINITTTGDQAAAVKASVGNITLTGDSVNISTMNNSAGIAGGSSLSAASSLIEVDAGRTTINAAREGIIIYSAGGVGCSISVNGDLEINSGLVGVLSQGGGMIRLSGGNASIMSSGNHGVSASGGDVILSGGSTYVRAGGSAGLTASAGGNITANTVLNAYGKYYGAVARAGSSISLAGVSGMSSDAGVSLYASGGTISSLGGAAHTYNMKGKILASAGGTVDLSMAGGSFISGTTRFEDIDGLASTGIINFALAGDSMWTVTGNSALTNLTLGQGSALQLAFSGSSLTDIISATGAITLEAGSYIYLTGDLSGLEGASFDFFDGTLVNNGVKFVGFDGTDWVEYEYTQTGANTFEFSANAPTVIEEPGFIPEPATATLGLLGLASLMVRRRRD